MKQGVDPFMPAAPKTTWIQALCLLVSTEHVTSMLDSLLDCYNSEALEFECRNGQKRAAASTCCYRLMCLGSLTAYVPVHCLQTEMVLQIFRQMLNFKEEAPLCSPGKWRDRAGLVVVCHRAGVVLQHSDTGNLAGIGLKVCHKVFLLSMKTCDVSWKNTFNTKELYLHCSCWTELLAIT